MYVKYGLSVVLSLAGVILPAAPFQNSPVSTDTNAVVNLSSLGSAGTGGDDTDVLQHAINLSSAMGKALQIPATATPYNVGPLTIPSNTTIVLDPGATILARPGFGSSDKLINIVGVSNVKIQGNGAVFQMRKSDYTSGEYRHCLDIEGSSRVEVSGISCNSSGGDGAYIGPGSGMYSSDISITDSTFSDNRRQGMSIISGVNVTVTRCTFKGTTGTEPSAGIDIEPNRASDQLQNILIQDSTTTENAGNGVAIDVRNLTAASVPVSIQINRHTSSSNGKSGYYATNENIGYNGSTGSINIVDSSSTLESQYGAVASFYNASGPALTFTNLNVLNANQSHNTYDNSAISVKRGGGGEGLIGNVSFLNPSIVSTDGKLDTYFSFWDYSNIGFTKVTLANPVTLSGARLGMGLLQGQRVLNISIP